MAVSAVRPVWDAWGISAKGVAWCAASCSGSPLPPLPLFIPDCPDLGPIYYENDETGEGLLAVLNGSLDGYRYRVEIGAGAPDKTGRAWKSRRIR